ncbi:MAG TPA: carbohydrate ABC transporter permease [Candidatus Eisenbergiella merdipullorum]|uniref:Carbohydrate ABC transporter permease n=1 Tax=Candidatus Eisenbergiella merdipullorum TaxID=2838553 RepID=A0A9D2KYL5_9FIRM|nr:carbohydrate ABC transporter permease [Candidatus Eisenbergiella merdipullorum]
MVKKNKTGQYILFSVLLLFTVICFAPVILVLIISLSADSSLALNGYSFFPSAFSLDGWLYVWGMKADLLQAYKITIIRTFVATAGTLLVESMTAYAISRSNFLLRGFVTKMMLFATLFSGSMLSSYVVNTTMYHLKDTFWILIIPSVGMMHIIMMRTYIKGTISDALVESSKIDGASDFRIFFQIILPLMKPSLAAVGFMTAVNKWNDWTTADLYITNRSLKPLQNYLMDIENKISALNAEENAGLLEMLGESGVPADSTRMALLFAVLGPIMIVYPFFQKYFVKGLTVGSIKG